MEEPIGHEHHEQRHPSPGEPTTTDPVCGMSVPPNSPHSYMHGGSRIVFCCGGCKDRFIENPAAYVLRTESRPDAATDGRVYTALCTRMWGKPLTAHAQSAEWRSNLDPQP